MANSTFVLVQGGLIANNLDSLLSQAISIPVLAGTEVQFGPVCPSVAAPAQIYCRLVSIFFLIAFGRKFICHTTSMKPVARVDYLGTRL